MKLILFALFVTLAIQVQSQTFEEIDQGAFVGTNYPSIAIANIDAGLNDTQEIIITGSGNFGRSAHLYSQDVNGNYVSVVGTFLDVIIDQAAVAFGDIDGDGDEDLLITSVVTKLYSNDGLGNFTEITSPIANVTQGAIAFFDIDNDTDLDLLVTGYNQDTAEDTAVDVATVLYTNDGNGNFVEVIGTPFENVANSTISYTDIDNDVDILITGSKWNFQHTANLYTNDGSGIFTEVAGTSFEPVAQGSTAFADIDNDGDQDIYLTGRDWQSQAFGTVYMNNGSGVFSENPNTGLTAVQESSIAFADVDGDTDLDVMITGLGTGGLFVNDGSGSFTEVAGLPFGVFTRSAIAFKDFDNDNDLDLIIAGYSINAGDFRTKLYNNTNVLGNTEFIEVVESIIYPNPVQDSFTVQLPEEYLNNFNQIAFNLYDSTGKKVVSIPDFSSENNQIDIQKLKSGLYVYEIISSERMSSTGKLVKK